MWILRGFFYLLAFYGHYIQILLTSCNTLSLSGFFLVLKLRTLLYLFELRKTITYIKEPGKTDFIIVRYLVALFVLESGGN